MRQMKTTAILAIFVRKGRGKIKTLAHKIWEEEREQDQQSKPRYKGGGKSKGRDGEIILSKDQVSDTVVTKL